VLHLTAPSVCLQPIFGGIISIACLTTCQCTIMQKIPGPTFLKLRPNMMNSSEQCLNNLFIKYAVYSLLFWHKFGTYYTSKLNSVAWVRERTIPTERPPLVSEVVPTSADRGCRVVSVTDPRGHNLGFLDRSRYFFFQVAPHLYSRGWVDPVPDPLLLRKFGSAGNRNRASGPVARNSGH
jgi:hypothetical protein